ncbi:carboxypeptidase M32 [Cellulosilyticum sp. I15G10I2]|uniref:carboxypeptidase M32 n=1 Tax=Cellulosilyticum sp. I15G10I2 TaxID=1892843 RepID=UPI00085C2369|nr:carboxypeptidase M32 [Cellulosilyticum sp. I15G10I2]
MKVELLRAYMSKMCDLNHAVQLLQWDLKTKAPKNAVDTHVAAIATLSTESFKMSVSDEMKEFILTFENSDKLDDIVKSCLKDLKRTYERSKNIPEKLYNEYVSHTSKTNMVWENAKRNNDFESFKPYLEKTVAYNKEMAAHIDSGKNIYDVLLDNYETGIPADKINSLFEELKNGVLPLLESISHKERVDDTKLFGDFEKHKQKDLAEYVLKIIGYDFESGRLDESEHPFTTGTPPHDVRVTTRYDEKDIRSALFTVIHEGGHGIYEQNISPALIKTPLAAGTCMGIHESQSRLYENMIGKNISFWEPIYNKVGEIFPQFQNIELEVFHKAINIVEPSLIRVDADELTYNLHIILRYELEKALFTGDLQVKDLPEAWREKMKKYLGITPPSDTKGVLQDCHWAEGAFGYFPSYALGNIYGAQFVQKMEEEVGSLDYLLKKQRLDIIKDWLRNNIHRFGKMKTSAELIKDVCKSDIDVKPIITYYQNKYRKLYAI